MMVDESSLPENTSIKKAIDETQNNFRQIYLIENCTLNKCDVDGNGLITKNWIFEYSQKQKKNLLE